MIHFENKKWLWVGRILTVIGVLFMLFDAVVHILRPAAVLEGFRQMGYSLDIIVPLSIVELVCILLYMIPRTSVLGAILLTGYLGGAVDANVRMGAPLFSLVLAPVYVAIVLWAGLYLRDSHLRAALRFGKN